MTYARYVAIRLAAAMAVTIVTTQTAHAEQPGRSADDKVTRIIAHTDLDLKSDEGKRILMGRVHHLVSELCNNDNLASSSARKRCKTRVLEVAAPQVQSAVLRAEAPAAPKR